MLIHKRVVLGIAMISLFIVGCSDDDKITSCFTEAETLSKNDFIEYTNRSIIEKVRFSDNSILNLPNTDSYNYILESNFIYDDTVYIKRIEKDKEKDLYDYDLLKLKKSEEFEIIESLNYKSSFLRKKLSDLSLSQEKDKVASIYHLSDGGSILRITDKNKSHIIFEKKYSFRVYIYQSPWSKGDSKFTFFNTDNEIYILDLKSTEVSQIPVSGINAMWLYPFDKISYLSDSKTIGLFDLKSYEDAVLHSLEDSFFSKPEILDYYWFSNQGKIYVKARFINKITDKFWTNESIILGCKDTLLE